MQTHVDSLCIHDAPIALTAFLCCTGELLGLELAIFDAFVTLLLQIVHIPTASAYFMHIPCMYPCAPVYGLMPVQPRIAACLPTLARGAPLHCKVHPFLRLSHNSHGAINVGRNALLQCGDPFIQMKHLRHI